MILSLKRNCRILQPTLGLNMTPMDGMSNFQNPEVSDDSQSNTSATSITMLPAANQADHQTSYIADETLPSNTQKPRDIYSKSPTSKSLLTSSSSEKEPPPLLHRMAYEDAHDD